MFGYSVVLSLALSQTLCSNTFSIERDRQNYMYIIVALIEHVTQVEDIFVLGSQRSILKKPRYFHWLVGCLTQTSVFVSGDFQMEIQAPMCLFIHTESRI